jgi:hypothetical protein
MQPRWGNGRRLMFVLESFEMVITVGMNTSTKHCASAHYDRDIDSIQCQYLRYIYMILRICTYTIFQQFKVYEQTSGTTHHTKQKAIHRKSPLMYLHHEAPQRRDRDHLHLFRRIFRLRHLHGLHLHNPLLVQGRHMLQMPSTLHLMAYQSLFSRSQGTISAWFGGTIIAAVRKGALFSTDVTAYH